MTRTPDAGFDDLARAAALVAGVPTAHVCLVDDQRPATPARVGLDRRAMPCAVVPRFGACAGFPLVSPSGDVLGALCLPGQ